MKIAQTAHAAVDAIDKAATNGNWNEAKAQNTTLGQQCQSCHGTYRERLEFETTDPHLQGEMRITTHLAPEGRGTRLTAVHENLPSGVTPADNEVGWRESLGRLAALLAPTP